MERMLRKKKDNSDYEIDRELTGKFAIEKNAEYQEKIEQLEEENKKLKKYYDRDKEELMESCYSLARENDELKKEIKELESDLEHRDSFFSIMRDVLANEEIDNSELASILYCVVHYECGDEEMSKKEVEIAEKFWFRDYV